MSIVHQTSNKKVNKKSDIGFLESWKLKEMNSLDVSYHTLVGGQERIVESKKDRVLIITQGFATNLDTKEIVKDGAIVEIPAGKTFRVQGQLKYYLIASK